MVTTTAVEETTHIQTKGQGCFHIERNEILIWEI